MRPQAEAPGAVREAVPRRLRELGMTLAARGFKVIVDADCWCMTAVNKAAARNDPSGPIAVAYGAVKLVQSVYLAADDTGALCWYWQWFGPTRGSLRRSDSWRCLASRSNTGIRANSSATLPGWVKRRMAETVESGDQA